MQINHHSYRKSILKLVKLQNLVAKCCKMMKIYSLVKFANLVYLCIACGNSYHIWTEAYFGGQGRHYIICKIVRHQATLAIFKEKQYASLGETAWATLSKQTVRQNSKIGCTWAILGDIMRYQATLREIRRHQATLAPKVGLDRN